MVVRGTLRLSAEGPRKTLVTTDPQPATLIFRLALLKKLRPPEQRTEQAWLQLTGTLKLQQPDSEPLFVVDQDPMTFDDPTLEDGETDGEGRPRRFVFFDFDRASFEGTPLKVPLPELEDDVRHLEVVVALQVAGATESPAACNDVLDKPVAVQVLDVSPVLALDTPVDDETEHNLVFRAMIPGDPFEVEKLRLGGDELVDGETFFQAPGRVFFRPPAKPTAPLKGILQTTDGRVFDFELGVAQTLRERMNSLSAQLEHATAMADAAAAEAAAQGSSADDANLVRDRLLSELFSRKVRLLDSIERTLKSDHDFSAFYRRAAALPTVLDGQENPDELA